MSNAEKLIPCKNCKTKFPESLFLEHINSKQHLDNERDDLLKTIKSDSTREIAYHIIMAAQKDRKAIYEESIHILNSKGKKAYDQYCKEKIKEMDNEMENIINGTFDHSR